jgi:hypothetical protein
MTYPFSITSMLRWRDRVFTDITLLVRSPCHPVCWARKYYIAIDESCLSIGCVVAKYFF